jgi:hypothetical protein
MNHSESPELTPPSTQDMPVPWERRRAPRHSVAENRLWIGWRKDEDFFVAGAQLMNISYGGALLVVEQPPLKGQTVWLRLEVVIPIEDVCAVVVDAARIGRGEYGVRISFREPFPTGFYQAAVAGLPSLHAKIGLA